MAELIDFPSTRGSVKTERMRVTTVSDMTRHQYPRRQNRDLAVLVVDIVGLWRVRCLSRLVVVAVAVVSLPSSGVAFGSASLR